MVGGIVEHRMLSKCLIKVRTLPGVTCSDIYHCLAPVLKKNPYHVILSVGTNDIAHYEGIEIIDKLLQLNSFIVEQLPTTHVVLSLLTKRTDLRHLAMQTVDIKSITSL